jgi:hypothetical protein
VVKEMILANVAADGDGDGVGVGEGMGVGVGIGSADGIRDV